MVTVSEQEEKARRTTRVPGVKESEEWFPGVSQS